MFRTQLPITHGGLKNFMAREQGRLNFHMTGALGALVLMAIFWPLAGVSMYKASGYAAYTCLITGVHEDSPGHYVLSGNATNANAQIVPFVIDVQCASGTPECYHQYGNPARCWQKNDTFYLQKYVDSRIWLWIAVASSGSLLVVLAFALWNMWRIKQATTRWNTMVDARDAAVSDAALYQSIA